MESKIQQTEFQKTEKLKTEKLTTFEKLKERYEQFRDSDLIRTFRNTLLALGTALYVGCAPTIQQTPTKPIQPTSQQTSTVQTSYTRNADSKVLPFDEENLKKLSRTELKGPNYTLHILYYKERVSEKIERVKKLDNFRQLFSYLYLNSKEITVVEIDNTKSNHYFSIGAYDYFFNIYTNPLEFELYVKTTGKGSYVNTKEELEAEFDMTASVLERKEPIKQNSIKVFISYVPDNVMYEDEKGIEESAIDGWYMIGKPRLLSFLSNDPNKPIGRSDLRESSVYQILRNTILSNAYRLSLDIDKNSGQKDPFLKGLINLAQNPTDPNTYSIIKPLFDEIEKQMVDIMLKKYRSYRNFYVGARILVFVIDPAKQDNVQIVVVPGYLSIRLDDSRYPLFPIKSQ
jgi:hypothetical protein